MTVCKEVWLALMDHDGYVKVLFLISAVANEHHPNSQWPLFTKPVRTRQGKRLIETIFFRVTVIYQIF